MMLFYIVWVVLLVISLQHFITSILRLVLLLSGSSPSPATWLGIYNWQTMSMHNYNTDHTSQPLAVLRQPCAVLSINIAVIPFFCGISSYIMYVHSLTPCSRTTTSPLTSLLRHLWCVSLQMPLTMTSREIDLPSADISIIEMLTCLLLWYSHYNFERPPVSKSGLHWHSRISCCRHLVHVP